MSLWDSFQMAKHKTCTYPNPNQMVFVSKPEETQSIVTT